MFLVLALLLVIGGVIYKGAVQLGIFFTKYGSGHKTQCYDEIVLSYTRHFNNCSILNKIFPVQLVGT